MVLTGPISIGSRSWIGRGSRGRGPVDRSSPLSAKGERGTGVVYDGHDGSPFVCSNPNITPVPFCASEEHSTDRLMLSSLENDLAIVDWRSAEQTLASLATLGVHVCRAPFALAPAPSAVAPGVRRVYVIDLRNAFKPDEVVEALMTLLKQRQVVTVSLAGLKPAIPKTIPSPEPDEWLRRGQT